MIDIANYKRSIAWLRRGMEEQRAHPEMRILQDGLTHSFEVTYNVTESTLREAIMKLTGNQNIGYLSAREVLRYASDEGLFLTESETWLLYGLAIEKTNARLGDDFETNVLPLLPGFAAELDASAERLEGRLALAA